MLRLAICAVLAQTICSAGADWSAGFYLGADHTQPATLFLDQPSLNTNLRFDQVHFVSHSFAAPIYFGARARAMFTKHFGLEAEFNHAKVYAESGASVKTQGTLSGVSVNYVAPLNQVVQNFSLSHGLNFVLLNAVFRAPILGRHNPSGGRLFFIGRLGAGATIPHVESAIQGLVREDYQVGRPAAQVSAGVELRTFRHMYVTTEYKFTYTSQRVDLAVGEASVLVRTHHFAAGLLWHFH